MPRRASVNKEKGRLSKKHNRHARVATKKGLVKRDFKEIPSKSKLKSTASKK